MKCCSEFSFLQHNHDKPGSFKKINTFQSQSRQEQILTDWLLLLASPQQECWALRPIIILGKRWNYNFRVYHMMHLGPTILNKNKNKTAKSRVIFLGLQETVVCLDYGRMDVEDPGNFM